jgi:thioesterase domain-containing protein
MDGSNRSLFYVHDDAPNCYTLDVAELLGLGINLTEIQTCLPAEPQLITVQGKASRVIRTIRAVQSSGPYSLIGCDSGGLVAYEIAIQLLGEDEEVGFLGMIRTRVPNFPHESNYVVYPVSIPVHIFEGALDGCRSCAEGWKSILTEGQIRQFKVDVDSQLGSDSSGRNTYHRIVANAVHGASKAIQSRPSISMPDHGYSPLVLLEAGPEHGTEVFCIPGAGASIASFVHLVGLLDRPVYGIQPRGLDSPLPPHSSITAAVRCYLKAIQRAKPNGPIHLVGHSFGGWIAFELARQLVAAGRPVESVVIIDSMAPSTNDAIVEFTFLEAVMQLVVLFEQLAGRALGITSADLQSLDELAIRTLVHQRIVGAGLVPHRSRPELLLLPLRVFASCLRIIYAPQEQYGGRIRLVLLRDPRDSERENLIKENDSLAGWRRLSRDITVWRGPGNHMTVFNPPHVETLARWLRAELNCLQRRPEWAPCGRRGSLA